MKRLAAPKHWYLGKLNGVYATKPSAGPHKTRQCIPLNIVLQQRLKYALSRDEARKIVRDKEGGFIRLTFQTFVDKVMTRSGILDVMAQTTTCALIVDV